MNLPNKLAISLLICCGMLVSQVEAAMPGVFSRSVVSESERKAVIVSEDTPIQSGTIIFLNHETFIYTYSTNGNLLTKGTSATLSYDDPTRPHAVTTATVKGVERTYQYDAAGYVYEDGKRSYEWTSFGQLRRLEYLAAPDLKDFSGNTIHSTATVTSIFNFDPTANLRQIISDIIQKFPTPITSQTPPNLEQPLLHHPRRPAHLPPHPRRCRSS